MLFRSLSILSVASAIALPGAAVAFPSHCIALAGSVTSLQGAGAFRIIIYMRVRRAERSGAGAISGAGRYFVRLLPGARSTSRRILSESGFYCTKVLMWRMRFSSNISSTSIRMPVSSTSPKVSLMAVPNIFIVGLRPM